MYVSLCVLRLSSPPGGGGTAPARHVTVPFSTCLPTSAEKAQVMQGHRSPEACGAVTTRCHAQKPEGYDRRCRLFTNAGEKTTVGEQMLVGVDTR